jgi:hypothetical protein
MKSKIFIIFSLLVLGSSSLAQNFNQRLSVQGFLKSGGAALNDNFGYFMQFRVKRNSTVVWCQSSAAKVPVVNGVFNSILSGNSNCSSLTNAMSSSVFTHSASSDTFTIDVIVDMSADGFGSSDDATFAGIDMVASPMSLLARTAEVANTISGILPITSGGTGSSSAAGARTSLGLGSVALLNVSGNANQVLLGDGSFGSVPSAALTLSGDVSGSPAATSVDRLKGRAVSATAPTANQVLTWNNGSSQWEPQTPAAAPVTSVAGRTGAVTISSADIADATALNTVSMIVRRDGSGNFSAGTITATISGSATNVTGTVAIANGGTGATTAGAALTALGAAASGTNTDITTTTATARASNSSRAPAAGGTTSAYTLAYSPTVSGSLVQGLVVEFTVASTNAANATLNVDGLGAVTMISDFTGANLAAGDLPTNMLLRAYYNGTNWRVSIPPRVFTGSNLNCGATINANTTASCPNITASGVNAGDQVDCSPSADPSANNVVWSSLATAGNIVVRIACNAAANCTMTNRNWRCSVQK